MTSKTMMATLAIAALGMSACSPSGGNSAEVLEGNGVSIRNLTASDVAAPIGDRQFKIEGTLIPTPSDTQSQHFLLRERKAIGGTIIAILREQRGDRVAYVRAEVDCTRRLFHVLGVAPSRAQAEVAIAHDGPLRPMKGLPLREELGGFICERSGTPLAPA